MRLSQLADAPITVELYVLAPNRMDPEFTAVTGDVPELGYAGLLDPSNIGPVSQIGQWLTEPTFLTRYDQVITDPSRITGDYTFTQAATDEEYQAVIFVDRDLGWLTGGLLALLGLTLLAVVPDPDHVQAPDPRRAPSRRGGRSTPHPDRLGRPARGQTSRSTVMLFVWVNASSMPSSEASRPRPLIL